MACDFQSLYSGEEGYVVRCQQCNHYQIAFISTLLTLQDADFAIFCRQVAHKNAQAYNATNNHSKIVVITTPCSLIQMVLTPYELTRLHAILELADNEMKAQELLGLFHNSL